MKILIVGSFDQSLVRFRGDLIRGWATSGHTVFASAPDISESVTVELERYGATAVSIPMRRAGTNLLGDLIYLGRLRMLIRQLRPDRIVLYTMKPVIYGSIAARMCGSTGVYSMITGLGYAFTGGGLKRQILSWVVRRLLKTALSRNDAVIFQNPDDRDEFQSLGLVPERTPLHIVNGSGVNCEHYSQAKLPSNPAFLLVARLIADKGVREYAAAARRVKLAHPDVPFFLVGWLDENPTSISAGELQGWIDDGIVDYLGALSDVREAISKCSVYVLPSYREGTPRTVLEAMSMGRAIITTDVPGCRETVTNGQNGLLVPARDSDALSTAMIDLLQDPQRVARMAKESRRTAETKYNVEIVNRAINGIISL